MLYVFDNEPNWDDYTASSENTKNIRHWYDDAALGGPSFLSFGPDNVTTPAEEWITNLEDSGYYKIINLKNNDTNAALYYDIFILTANLTQE